MRNTQRKDAMPLCHLFSQRLSLAAVHFSVGSGWARALALLLLLISFTPLASAQDYPSRLIKMIHGFPPGGNVDIIARLLSQEMQKGLGQSIVIEAKPGLAGNFAAEAVARADPDG